MVDAVFQDELRLGEEIARCPSCSLFINVIYDLVRLLVPAVHVFDSIFEAFTCSCELLVLFMSFQSACCAPHALYAVLLPYICRTTTCCLLSSFNAAVFRRKAHLQVSSRGDLQADFADKTPPAALLPPGAAPAVKVA